MVKETPNHNLNKYSQGDTEWTHSPDMQHIEERLVIRDLESNLDEYEPYPTATFVATDTGSVFDGDGQTWDLAHREFQSVKSNSLSHNPSAGVSQSIGAALADGLVVAETAKGKFHSFDVGNFDSTTSCWQQCLNVLQENGNGTLHIPKLKPGGDEWDPSGSVYWEGNKSSRIHINCHQSRIEPTHNDGSPIFEIRDGATLSKITGFTLLGNGNDAPMFRASNIGNLVVRDFNVFENGGYVGLFADDVFDYVIDDGFVDTYHQGGGFKQEDVANPSGDGRLGPGLTMIKLDRPGWDVQGCNGRNYNFSHMEGELDGALINYEDGSLYLCDGSYLHASGPHSECVRFSSKNRIVVKDAFIGAAGAGGIIIDDAYVYRIQQGAIDAANSIESNILQVNSPPDATEFPSILPYEATLPGSQTYPSEPWYNIRYPDGRRKNISGDVTVPAGGSAIVSKFLPKREIEVNVWLDEGNPPSHDVSWEVNRIYNSADDTQCVEIAETSGNDSVTLNYRILYRE